MNNDTYILMGGRGVKNNPYQTLKALVLYEENKKLKQTLTEIKTDILDIREGLSYFWVIDKCDEILQKISEVENE